MIRRWLRSHFWGEMKIIDSNRRSLGRGDAWEELKTEVQVGDRNDAVVVKKRA